jgi:hypothetical protein
VNRNIQLVFLFLVLTQAAHSVEEYFLKLYEVFAPARFISSLISSNLSAGFLAANAAIVALAVWCWAIPVRSGSGSARGVVWFWVLLEFGNGVGHTALALSRGGYFPGAGTAPLLIVFATWLAVLQAGQENRSHTIAKRGTE